MPQLTMMLGCTVCLAAWPGYTAQSLGNMGVLNGPKWLSSLLILIGYVITSSPSSSEQRILVEEYKDGHVNAKMKETNLLSHSVLAWARVTAAVGSHLL